MSTYNYNTGKITRDFKFVKRGSVCRLTQLPARVGNDWCSRCKHNLGTIHSWEYRGDDDFIKCSHEKQVDAEDCFEVAWRWNERFREEALCAFYS